jgi:hypothetical protein
MKDSFYQMKDSFYHVKFSFCQVKDLFCHVKFLICHVKISRKKMNGLIFYLKYFMYEMIFLSDESTNNLIVMKPVKKQTKNMNYNLKVINIETVDIQLITFMKLLILFRIKDCNQKVNNRTFVGTFLLKFMSDLKIFKK